MALTQTSILEGKIKLLVGGQAAFTDRKFDQNFDFGQTTEETHSSSYRIDGAVTDQAISLGKVNTPTFIFIKFNSKYNGDNSTTEDAEAAVTIKVDGGTAYTTNYFLAAVTDVTNNNVTSTITFTTLADTDTNIDLLVLGRSS